MVYRQQFQQYRKTQVETAPPERLVTMLYDGALRFLAEARDAMSAGRTEVANARLLRGQAILTELRCSLNHEAGELSHQLSSLYGYMHDRLVDANVSKESGPVAEVIELLSGLRDAWDQATSTLPPGPAQG